MSDLKTNLEQILQEKEDKIIPDNIKKDVQIFDVVGTYEGEEGIDTSDATAIADDILTSKTAYGSNGKLTGTMPNNGELNYTPNDEEQIIPKGYTLGGIIENTDITTLSDYKICDSLADLILGDSTITFYEYIETSGTQYFNTDISISNSKEEQIIIKYKPLLLGGGQCLFGTTDNNKIYFYAAGYTGNASTAGGVIFNNNETITKNVKIQDVTLTITSSSILYNSSDNNIETPLNNVEFQSGLLSIMNNNKWNDKGSIRLYSLEIYNKFNKLIHYLKPAMINETNVIGLYDIITQKMYTNSGTGELIKGGIL